MNLHETPRNIFTTIRFHLPNLSRVERKIAEYLLKHPEEASSLSLAETAKRCGCGEASVVRFSRLIGCGSYTEMKQLLSTQQDSEAGVQGIRIESEEPIRELADSICSLYIETIQRTMELNPARQFETAVRYLSEAKSIYFFGIGDALVPCECGYYRFRRIGFPCFFDADADMQMIHAANIREGDVAIAISHSGLTRHVVRAVRAARDAGARIIGITQSSRSPFDKYCDLVFYNAVSDITIGKTIVAHRLAESTIIEILYAGVVSQMPEKAMQMLLASSDVMKVNKEDDA